MPDNFENVNQENVNLVYDQLKNDHYLRHCLAQQDAMNCYNCLEAYKYNASDSNSTLLNSPYGNKYMAAVCTPAGKSINVRDSSNVDSAPCPVNQQCAGFTQINSPRHSCTADEITQIKSCAGGTNPVQAPDQNTCRAECVNDAILGSVQGLPICHKAYPGEGDTDEDYNQNYVKLTETQCNTSVDFDQDGDGVSEDLSEIYYWSSPRSSPKCSNRPYLTVLGCSEINETKLQSGITCENIVSVDIGKYGIGGTFCKTGIPSEGDATFCVDDDGFDVRDGDGRGRCYRPFPSLGLRGKVDVNGNPIFNHDLSNNDKKYCRTRISCERNETTKRCNVREDGGITLNLCENQPGSSGWFWESDNPVCQNSFAVDENIETAAALPEYAFAGIPGDDVLKCAKNPWCDIGVVVGASILGAGVGAGAFATTGLPGGVLSAAQKTRAAALASSYVAVNGMAQVGAVGVHSIDNSSTSVFPGTNQIRQQGQIKGITCGDGIEGCGANVNLVPEFIRQKPNPQHFWDSLKFKDISDCSIYWHEGTPICCEKDYECATCDGLS
jgi:hypothetical protein